MPVWLLLWMLVSGLNGHVPKFDASSKAMKAMHQKEKPGTGPGLGQFPPPKGRVKA